MDDRVALEAIMNKLKRTPHLFQKFVSSSAGKDVRVIAIGGKAVAAMERISAADFRSNLELGGTAQPYEIDGCLKTSSIILFCLRLLILKVCASLRKNIPIPR